VQLRNLADAERYLTGLVNLERTSTFDYEKLGLARILALLETQDHPERALEAIHVAGSKGKGSVVLAAERLLRAAGRRTGAYTSPHLESWRERFRVDGEPVGEAALVRTLERMRPAIEAQRRDPELAPSFFDVSTALAFCLFRELGVDAPRVCVITGIELEHTDKLGDTLEAIAGEKAGILKPGVPALHGPLPGEALAAIVARAIAEDVPLEEVRVAKVEVGPGGIDVRLEDGRRLRAPLLGVHHAINLALAVRAAEVFLDRGLERAELASLEALELPARVERIGDVILDVAHTPESARALRDSLDTVFPGRPWVLVLSVSRDKDVAGILQALAEPTRHVVVSQVASGRALDPERLTMFAWACGLEEVEEAATPARALAAARAALRPGELLVVAGSVYFAGAIRALLR
jgi:dihydrofolate synthase/folylpolyglutamate synthase